MDGGRRGLSFGFYMTDEALYLIDDTGELKAWMEKQADRLEAQKTPDQLFLQMLERLIEDDLLYLSRLERRMEEMEEALEGGIPKDFFAELTRQRKKLRELYQSRQDAQQNRIMCILTVVTTLFLPLTLLTACGRMFLDKTGGLVSFLSFRPFCKWKNFLFRIK